MASWLLRSSCNMREEEKLVLSASISVLLLRCSHSRLRIGKGGTWCHALKDRGRARWLHATESKSHRRLLDCLRGHGSGRCHGLMDGWMDGWMQRVGSHEAQFPLCVIFFPPQCVRSRRTGWDCAASTLLESWSNSASKLWLSNPPQADNIKNEDLNADCES